jgi:membrane-bound lytic murein transglycosylase A
MNHHLLLFRAFASIPLLALLALGACQSGGPSTQPSGTLSTEKNPGSTKPEVPVALPQAPKVGAESSSSSSAPANPGASALAGSRAEFATRHALFLPANFQQLPDWSGQSFDEALGTFKKSCVVLSRRPVWAESCREAEKIQSSDRSSMKAFFEKEFLPYQVLQRDRSATGSLTGYFEPLLKGSRDKRPPFVHPVYETPSDLLLLDAKEVEAATAVGDQARYLVDGREVKWIDAKGAGTPAGPRVFKLALNSQQAGTRDRKFRVRIEGAQIVSYPSRQDIEKSSRFAARPIAWVESREALYAMQIQGSGRILFPSGSVIRVAFAEQNGHAFLPRSDTNELALAPKTRSFQIETEAATSSPAKPGSASKGRASVQRNGTKPVASDSPPRLIGREVDLAQETIGSGFYGSRFESIRDPSYVFFREITQSNDGPIGAMGIPLTAGRSIAVDPRVTPLGSPVMIERRKSSGGSEAGSGSRLMVAQDTGGAIRGAVRADYFWGFGKSAGTQALRTNDELKMWILLPRTFSPSVLAASTGGRTRSLQGPQGAECVIPDVELCAE